jgi:hypothetical protein
MLDRLSRLGRLLAVAVSVVDVGCRLDGRRVGCRRIGGRRVRSLIGRGGRVLVGGGACGGGSGYLGIGRFDGIGLGHWRLFFLEGSGFGCVLFE